MTLPASLSIFHRILMSKIPSFLAISSLLTLGSLSAQEGRAVFEVEFKSTWTSATHPTNFPSNPHWSPLIGATHDGKTHLWMAGGIASAGIEQMAETGGTGALTAEINAAITAGGAHAVVRGGGLGSPASIKIRFVAESSHPFLSITTMLAPSPDWFAGLDSLPLMKNGRWIDTASEKATVWDAGTDSGVSYTSPNANTNPKAKIAVVSTTQGPFQGYSTSVGSWTVTRIASVQSYGCGINPAGSIAVPMGEPLLGQSVEVSVHDPLAKMAQGSVAFLMLGTQPASFPCGLKIPGFGMQGRGATGEWLLGKLAVLAPGGTWNGSPVSFKLGVPNNNSLIGARAFLQGGLANPTRLGLSDGIEVLLGK